jgi:ATP-dependent RNA helicase DeaD
MIKAIERVTKQRLPVEKVPTVADLRARRLELTRAALHESLLEDDLDRFRVVVETLAEEFDVVDVALAAVKLAHESGGAAADEDDIPEVSQQRRDRDDRPRGDGGGKTPRKPRGPSSGMTRLFVGAGRTGGIRPQDLVGAIANESSLSGRDIGAIEIADRYSLVEVPDAAADDVINALRGSTIKGKKATVRRERF